MDQTIKALLAKAPMVPVIVIDDLDDAVPLAQALVAGGIPVLEITLRTPQGLDAISKIKAAIPDAIVGAGTVVSIEDLHNAQARGADFIVSPGLTANYLQAAKELAIPILPGISTVSELMLGLEYGVKTFKFFPAEASGGVKVLKAFGGPFPDVCFCPTGGVDLDNIADYLSLKSVLSVGGSWVCPASLVKAKDWQTITKLASEAAALVKTF